jgi:hypothetical protein
LDWPDAGYDELAVICNFIGSDLHYCNLLPRHKVPLAVKDFEGVDLAKVPAVGAVGLLWTSESGYWKGLDILFVVVICEMKTKVYGCC